MPIMPRQPEDFEDDDIQESKDYTGPIPDDAPARQREGQREQERLAREQAKEEQ